MHFCSIISFFVLLLCVQYSYPQDGGVTQLSPPYTCTTTTTRCHPGRSTENAQPEEASSPTYFRGRDGKRGEKGGFGVKGEKGDPCHCDVADEVQINELSQRMDKLEADEVRFREMSRRLKQLEDRATILPASCAEYKSIQTNFGNENSYNALVTIYPLKHLGNWFSVVVNCTAEGEEDWIVIQRRMDGSVDFYRGWQSYAEGFGNPSGEYWIGLKILHTLTTTRNYKLRIELMNWENEKRYAEYSTFQVDDEASKFRLTVGGYSGTAGESLIINHNGQKFSTFDDDNDEDSSSNCAVSYSGAWWYKSGHYSNLNGKYFPTSSAARYNGISWHNWLGVSYSLKFVEMKIKPV